ncbi:hypothetical protein MGYG_01454 [Nannizzia gypsea CBS 118893]|uniref:Uncharacterized protein n=1 Tax=Arthroderma gypseum (strain ATCC MYA-4604 / CBS 118893) TaxID=535722 RepID=E5R0Y2_ARTGP|nr:hypothetical protein MGYG_01454 [Nannizzia gypsea CBS 118893]EFQ98424.1 hypothetical protein MGYG_01454 [Nannizzia gypsea CBS 118893]
MVKWTANGEVLLQREQRVPSHLDSISKQKETEVFNLQLRFTPGVTKAKGPRKGRRRPSSSLCGSPTALERLGFLGDHRQRSVYLDLNPESQGEVSINPKPKRPLQSPTRENMCWTGRNQ